jgi:hypothetical protein
MREAPVRSRIGVRAAGVAHGASGRRPHKPSRRFHAEGSRQGDAVDAEVLQGLLGRSDTAYYDIDRRTLMFGTRPPGS